MWSTSSLVLSGRMSTGVRGGMRREAGGGGGAGGPGGGGGGAAVWRWVGGGMGRGGGARGYGGVGGEGGWAPDCWGGGSRGGWAAQEARRSAGMRSAGRIGECKRGGTQGTDAAYGRMRGPTLDR